MRSAMSLRPQFLLVLLFAACFCSMPDAAAQGDEFASDGVPHLEGATNSFLNPMPEMHWPVQGDILNPVIPPEDYGDEFDPAGQPEDGENLLSYVRDDEFTGLYIDYYSPRSFGYSRTFIDGTNTGCPLSKARRTLVLRKMIAETPNLDSRNLCRAYLAMYEARWSDSMKALRLANLAHHPGFAMQAEQVLAQNKRYREQMELIDLIEASAEGNRRRRRREVEDEYLDSLSGMLPATDYREFELHRFPRRSLTVSIAPGWAGDRDGEMRTDDLKKLVSRAMAAINQAMRNRIALRLTTDTKHADINVKWEPGSPVAPPTPEYSGGKLLGVTTYQDPTKHGFIDHANITIFLQDDFTFDVNHFPTVLHELLHAVGIGRHCHDTNDVMYGSREWYVSELSAHNKRVLRLLYSKTATKKLPIGNRAKSA